MYSGTPVVLFTLLLTLLLILFLSLNTTINIPPNTTINSTINSTINTNNATIATPLRLPITTVHETTKRDNGHVKPVPHARSAPGYNMLQNDFTVTRSRESILSR